MSKTETTPATTNEQQPKVDFKKLIETMAATPDELRAFAKTLVGKKGYIHFKSVLRLAYTLTEEAETREKSPAIAPKKRKAAPRTKATAKPKKKVSTEAAAE